MFQLYAPSKVTSAATRSRYALNLYPRKKGTRRIYYRRNSVLGRARKFNAEKTARRNVLFCPSYITVFMFFVLFPSSFMEHVEF